LPGIDGSGLSGGTQWGRLSSELTIEVLSLTPGDRSTFDQLVVGICGHIAGLEPPRRVLLCGESTGAVLALGAALAEPGLVSALCLVNPGTAYDGSPLSVVAPLLPRLPPQLYSVGPSLVTPLLGKPGWFNPLIRLPADEKLPTGAARVLEASRQLADLLPPEVEKAQEARIVLAREHMQELPVAEVFTAVAARKGSHGRRRDHVA